MDALTIVPITHPFLIMRIWTFNWILKHFVVFYGPSNRMTSLMYFIVVCDRGMVVAFLCIDKNIVKYD